MNLYKQTTSLCSICYREVPATICISEDGVWITKMCPVHEPTSALLERDSLFYSYIIAQNSPRVYCGYFVDVTRECNLHCKYCFYPVEKNPVDVYSIRNIVSDCTAVSRRKDCSPIILTGGEPTVREDIVELVIELRKLSQVCIVSNGVNLAKDNDLFKTLLSQINTDGITNLNLSIHHTETDEWKVFIEKCRVCKIKLESALIVIDSEKDFINAINICKSLTDVVDVFRIKAATKLWDEQKPKDKIFCSDMFAWLNTHFGKTFINNTLFNKSVFVNVVCEGLKLMLVSWNDIHNVDLLEIDCPPFYRAKNGGIYNFVTSCLINEGISKGWINGNKNKKDGKV